MAHSIVRVNSMNDRYVTETMIDLNLNLNEEIDFDFFDNAQKPDGQVLGVNDSKPDVSESELCSSSDSEDDNDVQVSPQIVEYHQTQRENGEVAVAQDNCSTDDNLEECVLSKRVTEINDSAALEEFMPLKTESDTNVNSTSEECSYSNSFEDYEGIESKEDLTEPHIETSTKVQSEDIISPQPTHYNTSQTFQPTITNNETCLPEPSDSVYDSDGDCPFEGSDDELLMGVHTLTIIPRDKDEEPSADNQNISDQDDDARDGIKFSIESCEKAVTVRSSSGYSSASYKGNSIMRRTAKSKAEIRQSPLANISTPDMEKFIKSFKPLHSASPSVSFASFLKYPPSKIPQRRPRKNMSFSNEEMNRIERENAILLNKIVLQQRPRPVVVHNYERRVTSNAINRARLLKKIEFENEILLKKIQDVKRKSSLSTTSRCTSQASASQF